MNQILEGNGFVIRRQSGSHVQLYHATDSTRFVTVPYHARDLAPKALRSIIQRAGWTVDAFVELL